MPIIYPMFCLILLTFGVGLSLGVSRFISVRKGQVNPRYYKLFAGEPPPELVQKLGRNFSNLLETPILFYLVCVLVIVLGIDSPLLLGLAWAYFALRVVHSIVHISYNNPLHRFLLFLVSGIVLLVMWVELILIVG